MGIEVFETKGLQQREELVQSIKEKAGELDDLLRLISKDKVLGSPWEGQTVSRHHACIRMTELARNDLESAVMWAVKAISRS